MIDSKQCSARSGPAGGGSRPAGPWPGRRSTAMRVLAGGRAAGPLTPSCTRRGPVVQRQGHPAGQPHLRRTSPRPWSRPTAAASESAEVPHLACGFLRPHGPVGPRMALAWPLLGQRLDLPGVLGQRGPMRSWAEFAPARNRKVGYTCPAWLRHRGRDPAAGAVSLPVVARLLPGRAIKSDAGPAAVTRQAGD
jgi:hypothetical protein